MNSNKPKVTLAFSGGLDTSFCVLYLREKGYNVITVTVDTGGLPDKEKEYIANRSKELGAAKHVLVDAQRDIYDEIIANMIRANGLYEGVYPNMCADRYTIAKHTAKIAREVGAEAVSHGCTGAGNDQIRMDITFAHYAPELIIIAPIRELMITRPKEIAYLEKLGFKVPVSVKKYTINENVFGRTISGSEIDRNREPAEEAWVLSRARKKKPEYFTIAFKDGAPVGLNGKATHGSDILKLLNVKAGAHGYGRACYIEDATIGIKGYQAFEAPGMLLLIEAHRALERLVLTRRQLSFKAGMDLLWADYAFRGLFYEPLVSDIHAFLAANQKLVEGEVVMKVDGGTANAVEVHSKHSLFNEKIGAYAQKGSWKGAEAEGFIRFYGLQQRIAGLRDK